MKQDWIKLVDKYWYTMSEETRKKTFEDWVSQPNFNEMREKDEDVKLFYARFHPDNQFTVTTNFNGTVNKMQAFKWGSKYHVGSMSVINNDYITEIEKITFNKTDKD